LTAKQIDRAAIEHANKAIVNRYERSICFPATDMTDSTMDIISLANDHHDTRLTEVLLLIACEKCALHSKNWLSGNRLEEMVCLMLDIHLAV